jgi:hypothetical protein
MAVVTFGVFLVPHLFAEIKNPVSKLYVSDLKGEADLHTSDSVTSLTKKTVFNAEGATVMTNKKSNDAMAYSNGTGIYLDANTRIDVKKFVQEPFTPNRYDLDVEPSVSQTQADVPYGLVALCTSKLAAGSNMVYTTPQATLDIRGKKLVVEVNDNETRVSVLEGDVTVRTSNDSSGKLLHGGQEAIIRSNAAQNTSDIVSTGPIPDKRKQFLSDRASLACIAKQTVYFAAVDVKETNGETAEVIHIAEVIPTNKPTDFTVSPSQLSH